MSSTLQAALRASLIVFLFWLPLAAQQDRINGPIDSTRTVTLRGMVSPNTRRAKDLGPVDPSQKLSYITLGFSKSAAQQAALDRLLVELQDASSPNFHKWLSPEEFGQRFGVSPNDIALVSAWLKSQNLTVLETARGRGWMVFSGTAAQVEQAFHVEIHGYELDGERHFAIASEPSVPAALAPLVLGFRGLDDFWAKPTSPRSQFDLNGGGNALVAGDIETIYDISPMYQMGIDGTGQTVVIVGASDVYQNDIASARSNEGLPPPRVQYVTVGADPGVTGAQGEANVDLEWLAAVAPNVTIYFVVAGDVFVATQYAVDQNYAPVLSMSFSFCEANASSEPVMTEALAQQANTQGITWMVASGDQAVAPCDRSGSTGEMPAVATQGLSVNFPSTLPEVTAVGGTMFNENGAGNYWNPTNFSNGSSALSYIPEAAWNEITANGGIILGGTGGVSSLFAKPAWQTGPGVPNDGARDVPDVALDGAVYHDPYFIFTNDGQIQMVGGSSVAAPIFAGMMVLLNQYLVTNGLQAQPGLGNVNPALYRMAQTTPQAFHDITEGNNIVPCQIGTPDCSTGSFGYRAGPGYDLATGLGSVDATNLITLWNSSPGAASSSVTVSVSANPSSVTVEGTTVVTATVQAPNGSPTPTGSVSFVSGTTSLGTAPLGGSGNTATASLTVYGSQLPVGSDTIAAVYAGSSASNSASGSVTVNVGLPTAAAAVVPSFTPDPVYKEPANAQGYTWFVTLTLTNMTSVAATLTDFTIGGTDYASLIPAVFGNTELTGYGTLQGFLDAKDLNVPVTVPIGFSGVDANGNQWSQQISVPFKGPQTSASIALTSAPTVVQANPNAPSDCRYLQEIDVQERNGVGVVLTRFTIDTFDYTSQIQNWFGSLRLAPFGALEAFVCVNSSITVPQTAKYELDGVDTRLNNVEALGSAQFQGPASNPGLLSVSSNQVLLNLPNASAGPASSTLNIDVPPGQSWSLGVFPSNQSTSWLVASPLSGTGPAQVTVTASGDNLSNGAYLADLSVQSLNTIPQFTDVLVALVIGASENLSVDGVTNGASFQVGAAPGMVLSVFGTNLAPSTKEASSLPLPLTLAGVSATINGVPAPLYYVSPGQLNIQIPYETPAGSELLAVNNNGQVFFGSFDVSFSYPGIFADGNGNTVPYASGKRGQTLILFITGEGDVTPALATGASPKAGTAVTKLPAPVLKPQKLTIGGVEATIDFIGVPPGLAGVTQVNFTVPNNAPTGRQPVQITIGTATSAKAFFTVNP